MSAVQPAGTVTLVFTDIAGSTGLLEALGTQAYRTAFEEHRTVVRRVFAAHGGYEVDNEGDGFFYAFSSAQAAVSAVREAMLGLEAGPIRVRVGIHTGDDSCLRGELPRGTLDGRFHPCVGRRRRARREIRRRLGAPIVG